MNKEYYFFRPDSFFGGPVDVTIDVYQPIRQQFINYWMDFRMMSSLSFSYKPYGSNPFKDVLFFSKGRYDIANHYNGFGPNFLFVSDRMLEIFKSLNIPEFELFPLKYRQKGNIYIGYFIAFLQDYSMFIDFEYSKICYKPYGQNYFQPVRFQSSNDLLGFIKENASIRYSNGGTNLGDFKFPKIRFKPIVYEMDLLCVPFLTTTFLMSEQLKTILEKEKNVKINFMNWDDLYFKDCVLVLAPRDCC